MHPMCRYFYCGNVQRYTKYDDDVRIYCTVSSVPDSTVCATSFSNHGRVIRSDSWAVFNKVKRSRALTKYCELSVKL